MDLMYFLYFLHCELVILWNYCGIVLSYFLTWYICSTILQKLCLWKSDVPDTLFCIQVGHKALQVMKRKYFNDGATTFLYLWVEVKHLFWITNCLLHIWACISVLFFPPIYFYKFWLKWHISLYCVASPWCFLTDST